MTVWSVKVKVGVVNRLIKMLFVFTCGEVLSSKEAICVGGVGVGGVGGVGFVFCLQIEGCPLQV